MNYLLRLSCNAMQISEELQLVGQEHNPVSTSKIDNIRANHSNFQSAEYPCLFAYN